MTDEWVAAIGCIILIVLLIVGAIWWEWYKFKDCMSVGHSTFYCVCKTVEGVIR